MSVREPLPVRARRARETTSLLTRAPFALSGHALGRGHRPGEMWRRRSSKSNLSVKFERGGVGASLRLWREKGWVGERRALSLGAQTGLFTCAHLRRRTDDAWTSGPPRPPSAAVGCPRVGSRQRPQRAARCLRRVVSAGTVVAPRENGAELCLEIEIALHVDLSPLDVDGSPGEVQTFPDSSGK